VYGETYTYLQPKRVHRPIDTRCKNQMVFVLDTWEWLEGVELDASTEELVPISDYAAKVRLKTRVNEVMNCKDALSTTPMTMVAYRATSTNVSGMEIETWKLAWLPEKGGRSNLADVTPEEAEGIHREAVHKLVNDALALWTVQYISPWLGSPMKSPRKPIVHFNAMGMIKDLGADGASFRYMDIEKNLPKAKPPSKKPNKPTVSAPTPPSTPRTIGVPTLKEQQAAAEKAASEAESKGRRASCSPPSRAELQPGPARSDLER